MSDQLPASPPVLEELFPPDRLEIVQSYAHLLATDGVVRGLLGPREVPRLWERHLINCALLAPCCGQGATVADVGSGAGLPGLVLAIARPDLRVTLIEPLLRRTRFLDEVVETLGLANVSVIRGRAEEQRSSYDIVTSRAVAPLERLLGWCMPLVAGHGEMVAMKGSAGAEEIESARSVWSRMGCEPPTLEVLPRPGDGSQPLADVDPIRVVRVAWAEPSRVSLSRSGHRRSARSRSPRSRKSGR